MWIYILLRLFVAKRKFIEGDELRHMACAKDFYKLWNKSFYDTHPPLYSFLIRQLRFSIAQNENIISKPVHHLFIRSITTLSENITYPSMGSTATLLSGITGEESGTKVSSKKTSVSKNGLLTIKHFSS